MEGERNVARKMARYMWRVKRSIWEMERQIPSLLELVFRIKLAKIAKGRGLPSLLEMLLEDIEAWIHPIKAITLKKDKPGVPKPKEVYDSGNEPSDEDELRAYQSTFGLPVGTQGEVGRSSTNPHHHNHPWRRTRSVLPLP